MALPQNRPIPAANDNGAPTGKDFLNARRILVRHGALFLDPSLVVDRRLLDPSKPEYEQRVRQMLDRVKDLNAPSFFDSNAREQMALALASLVPVPAEAKRAELLQRIDQHNREVSSGHSELHTDAEDADKPFAAVKREAGYKDQPGPVDLHRRKTGLTLYLILREAFTRAQYPDSLASYMFSDIKPDAASDAMAQTEHELHTAGPLLQMVSNALEIAPETLEKAGRNGGVPAIAKALGVEDAYVQEVQQVVDKVAAKDFSYYTVEHWHIGRQLLSAQTRPVTLDEKIAVGRTRWVDDMLVKLRHKCRGVYDVPKAVKRQEQWVARQIDKLDPVQRRALWNLGYDICYTRQPHADAIAFFPHIYGLHRQIKNHPNDFSGIYRIYFAGVDKQARATFQHEVAHNLWPQLMTDSDVQKIDGLLRDDAGRIQKLREVFDTRFEEFSNHLDAYHAAATPEAKSQALAAANTAFAKDVGPLDTLFAEQKDADEIRDKVNYADNELRVGGRMYRLSDHYTSSTYQLKEMISRYKALESVLAKGQPALLSFVAPGLQQVYQSHYLPHLSVLDQQVTSGAKTVQSLSEPKPQRAPIKQAASHTTHGAQCPCCNPGKKVQAGNIMAHKGMKSGALINSVPMQI